MTVPGHVLNAGDTAVKRAGVLPALRELTVFEFKASNWIGNRAELLFPDWQRRGGGEEEGMQVEPAGYQEHL